MRILVTGASGFLGRRVTEAASAGGSIITKLDLLPDGLSENDDFIQCDITDPPMVKEKLRHRHFDSVIHLAGIRADLQTMKKVNVGGTANLLNSLTSNLTQFTAASSCSVYGIPDNTSGCIEENHPVAPITDYGRTMLAREQTISEICSDRGISVASARLFNLFGPGQSTSMMTSAVAEKLIRIHLKKAPAPLKTGPLHTMRDLVDVRDAADAISRMTLSGTSGIFNVGTGKPVSGWEVVRVLQHILGSDIPVEEGRADGPMVERIYAGIEKARQTLGWEPVFPLETTLRNILDDLMKKEP